MGRSGSGARQLRRRDHRHVPRKGSRLRSQRDLLEKDERSEGERPVKNKRGNPAGCMCFRRGLSRWLIDACHNRITSRLTC